MKKRHCFKSRLRQDREAIRVHGQHFLHDNRIIMEMISKAGIHAFGTVVDIGAGAGAITLLLAEKAGKVLAVENDPGLAESLRRRTEGYSSITVVEKDILETRMPGGPYCVVANIPFFLTTPILRKLLDPPVSSFQSAVLIIERGAALGLTETRVRNPRILTWRMRYEMELVRVVSRSHFSPQPSVDSAIFHVRRKKNPFIAPHHHERFSALAEYGLKFPMMPIHEALKGIFTPPQLKHLLKNIGTDRHEPVCTLSEQQWSVVFHTMLEHVESYRWPRKQRK
ncbi:23S ribosomal RNA methyltransferase Erm [Paenibacillus sp. sptzw28]|uniref:23S ribosomal RNA methyltransferase Erm n=1 Tax=Paenibacillus sp. sptzw28 TaxID=715179 RepID=UPI001C6E382C|nr:23S ribosomal RNA methyltransferase Erm [Paenibacillus sp. sptzw28]QYR21506.1 23S ribosomal RNA methyltransferase Erm [Paenibacillus sp. sptzw28]